ncbi:DgyrCDS14810 [Dimorphilus gyrociliatus]|uniref:DgyrCDS14810 n=1 Tax=Dimorphilus gyrociliatus TaxID=2664684 RepID=A0A7I8WF00_9ANNE|nr:DgyrCDS14810 [Dimorphilus gyrociliatus]
MILKDWLQLVYLTSYRVNSSNNVFHNEEIFPNSLFDDSDFMSSDNLSLYDSIDDDEDSDIFTTSSAYGDSNEEDETSTTSEQIESDGEEELSDQP